MLIKFRRLAVESAHSSFPLSMPGVWGADFSVCDKYKWLLALEQDCTPTGESSQEGSSWICVSFVFRTPQTSDFRQKEHWRFFLYLNPVDSML